MHQRGGIRTNILGRDVVMKPWIHFVIGDAARNNEVCGHFNHYGKCSCPYRDCACIFEEMGDAVAYYQYVNLEELSTASETADKHGRMKDISKHKIENAFDNSFVPLSDNVCGIHGIVPPEGLHTFGSGIYETLLGTVHDIVGVGNKHSTDKETINYLHLIIVETMKRQSELDMPKPMVKNGIMDGTQMGAMEQRANVLALVLTLKTKAGKLVFKKHCERDALSLSKMLKTAILLLACEKWCHSNLHVGDVDISGLAFRELKRLILKHYPCDKICKKGNGWRTPKFHAISKFPKYMKKYGSATNFNSGPGEHNLQDIVKHKAQNTNRQSAKFTSQIATRNYKSTLINMAYSCIRDKVGDFIFETDENDELISNGKFTVTFGVT